MSNQKRFHVAVIGCRCENSSFSPLLTELADFRALTWDADPPALAAHYAPVAEAPAGSRLDLAEAQPRLPRGFDDLDFSYVCSYRATPGGPISAPAWANILQTVRAGLAAALAERGPLHGVWMDLHGAMYVDGQQDAEAGLLGLVRQLVGPQPLLSASYDLHGNFSPAACSCSGSGLAASRSSQQPSSLGMPHSPSSASRCARPVAAFYSPQTPPRRPPPLPLFVGSMGRARPACSSLASAAARPERLGPGWCSPDSVSAA